tara:strand:- start:513 stop:1136 length:624 start_codon:yes stop_codon:yes gene_type:complete
MALQTSGSISLNQIHVEASNSATQSGSTVSLNDSDVRGLTAGAGKTIDNTAGSAIDFSDFYGASYPIQNLDQQTVTAGFKQLTYGTRTNPNQTYTNYYGWSASTLENIGSIADGTFNVKGGYTIRNLFLNKSTANTTLHNKLSFEVSGTHANSQWTTLTITKGSTTWTFSRASATFNQYTGFVRWRWTDSTGTVLTVNGGTYVCTFT